MTVRTFRGSARILSAELLAVPAGLFIVAFLTRVLGPERFGVYTLAVAMITWLEWSLNVLFGRASVRLIAETEDWKPNASAILRLVFLSSALVAAALSLTAGWIASLFGEPELIVVLRCLALDIPIWNGTQSYRAFAVGRENYAIRSRLAVIRWILRPLFTVCFVSLFPSLVAAAVAWVLASLCELLLGHLWIPVPLFLPSPQTAKRRLFAFALPLAAFGLIMRFYDKLDLFVLKISGASTIVAGIYGAAQSISLAPGILTLSFAPLLLSALTRSQAQGLNEEGQTLTRNALRLLLVFFPYAVLCSVASDDIVRIVFGSAFLDSAPLLRWLAFSGYSATVIACCSSMLVARENQSLMARICIPMLPAALAGYLIFIPHYGPAGAAAVNTLVTGATALVMTSAVFRVWQIQHIWGTVARSLAVAFAIAILIRFWETSPNLVLPKLLLGGSAIPLLFVFMGEWKKPDRQPMPEYWGNVANEIRSGMPLECWRKHMKVIYRRLVDLWLPENGSGTALKTDLFEEALSKHNLLPYLGPKSIGLDHSLSVARSARDSVNGNGANPVIVCDLRNLPLRTDSITRILSGSSLDHFAHEEEMNRAIGELARVLAPGGTLVLTLDNPFNPIVWLRNRLPLPVAYYVGYTCSASEAREKLEAAGLKVTDCAAILHVPRAPAIWLTRLLERWGRKKPLEWFEKHMEKWERLQQWPTRFRTGYYIALRAEK